MMKWNYFFEDFRQTMTKEFEIINIGLMSYYLENNDIK
jgi:hypothetical protein